MQEIQITRSFKYNSVTLPDPNPALGPDQIREFYATQYPELNNAVVEGPVTKNAVATYTFTRAAGAKGELEAAVEVFPPEGAGAGAGAGAGTSNTTSVSVGT